jgi:hypothetical protein
MSETKTNIHRLRRSHDLHVVSFVAGADSLAQTLKPFEK